ncbi:MAG: FAD-dependent monooxygenase [Pseudonocardiaceae bacterium]
MRTQVAEVPVLIVGAGPTGVTLGIELRRRGVACRVVDRLAGPVTASRSFTLHARTLELFEMVGIAESFLERGLRAVSMDYHFKGTTQPARLDFSRLPSRYPFTLVISQNVTEQVLRDQLTALATPVEWDTELRSLSQAPDGRLTALLVHRPSGREETVRTRWLVGADGVQSTVRAQLGIPYEGDEYTGMQMRMIDVPLRGFPLEDDRIHYFISTARLLLVTKLPGANYRVLISDVQATPSAETARSAFQDVLDEHFCGSVSLGEPEWASVFRIWKRVTPRYRHGSVLLAGDAAHCHSPAGGQGMNVCIQDAFNLGWKLALVCAGQAGESLLDTYEPERRPIAQQVIEGTNALHAIILAHGVSIEDRIALSREPSFTRQAISKISGLAYHYRDVAKPPPGFPPLAGLAAGDRVPDTRLDPGLRLHELLRHERHTLLVSTSNVGSAALERLVGELTRRFGTWLRVEVPALAPVKRTPPAALGHAAADGDVFCLVRPDGYLAMRVRFTGLPALLVALTEYLSKQPVKGEVPFP